ncbi:MAG: hypothetical protein DYG98_18720 [Haliscomenobacteraceae bacterium CHB4]|nr:hypothetical protein [Haliscomenobacteraceae bacterium CHB4]
MLPGSLTAPLPTGELRPPFFPEFFFADDGLFPLLPNAFSLKEPKSPLFGLWHIACLNGTVMAFFPMGFLNPIFSP